MRGSQAAIEPASNRYLEKHGKNKLKVSLWLWPAFRFWLAQASAIEAVLSVLWNVSHLGVVELVAKLSLVATEPSSPRRCFSQSPEIVS